MSKTFKALQRAARQRFEKTNSAAEPVAERVVEDAKIRPLHRPPPAAPGDDSSGVVSAKAPGTPPRKDPAPDPLPEDDAEFTDDADHEQGQPEPAALDSAAPVRHPWMPAEAEVESARAELGGKTDPLILQILEEGLGPAGAGGGIRMESDGWVRGRLDERRVAALLERFALLHVLRQDARNWYWFWGVKGNARDLARRTGLPLDLETDSERP